MNSLDYFNSYFDSHKEKLLEDFFAFLRFESISTDGQYAGEVEKCAAWLQDYISGTGLQADSWATKGHPTIFAERCEAGESKPTVLIYCHYDVQPVDPIELWQSPPFEPTVRDGEVYARGAMDDKGQCFYVISALRALMERDGSLPVNVKLCIEGEEETGSSGLRGILEERRDQLKSDYLFVVDLGIHGLDRPAVTLGIRGLTGFTIELTECKTDLHSGTHGGIAYNPNHAMIELLAKMRNSDGKITIPGFYDDILELSAEEKANLDLTFDVEEYIDDFGGKPNGGEKQFSPLESSWLRPTLEVNGIHGGYGGQGFKTVIPAKALAKVSCRLVPNQDPEKIEKLVTEFIKANIPDSMEVKITSESHGASLRASPDTPAVAALAKAYEEVCQQPTHFIQTGGSIPIAADLAQTAGASAVLFGYGLPGDCLHAPNEHFGIDRIRMGMATLGRALELLGQSESEFGLL